MLIQINNVAIESSKIEEMSAEVLAGTMNPVGHFRTSRDTRWRNELEYSGDVVYGIIIRFTGSAEEQHYFLSADKKEAEEMLRGIIKLINSISLPDNFRFKGLRTKFIAITEVKQS